MGGALNGSWRPRPAREISSKTLVGGVQPRYGSIHERLQSTQGRLPRGSRASGSAGQTSQVRPKVTHSPTANATRPVVCVGATLNCTGRGAVRGVGVVGSRKPPVGRETLGCGAARWQPSRMFAPAEGYPR